MHECGAEYGLEEQHLRNASAIDYEAKSETEAKSEKQSRKPCGHGAPFRVKAVRHTPCYSFVYSTRGAGVCPLGKLRTMRKQHKHGAIV